MKIFRMGTACPSTRRRSFRLGAAFLLILGCEVVSLDVQAQTRVLYDGRLFDQGVTMTERSPFADSTLDLMRPMLGKWQVRETTWAGGSEAVRHGTAAITYMNRGYSYMERLHLDSSDADGEGNDDNVDNDVSDSIDRISFLTYQAANTQWMLGVADSWTETVELFNGHSRDRSLVLTNASRRRGGPFVVMTRVTYRMVGDRAFEVTSEVSTDFGATWKPEMRRDYERATDDVAFAAIRADFGRPSPDRAPESASFDFLIGKWNAIQELRTAAEPIRFRSDATAVYTLGGRGVLEFSWYDVDPNLPDAATTIVRIYNSAERRWESLYHTNRGNGMLDFGGNKEGDEVILHLFDTNRRDNISRFVFHSIADNTYAWYSELSSDAGKSFRTNWSIEFERADD